MIRLSTGSLKRKCFILSIFLFYCVSIYSIPVSKGINESKIKQNKEIIAYGEIDFPPYEYTNEQGEIVGFNIDLFQAIMHELKLDYELKIASLSSAKAEFDDNKGDVIIGMLQNNSQYVYSVPTLYVYNDIVCRKDFEFYDINDIKGKQIIMNTNIRLIPLYSKLDESNDVIVVDNVEDGFKLLANGKYDLILCDSHQAQHILNKYGYDNLQLRHINKLPYNFGIAVNKNNLQLRDDINEAFNKLKDNGVYDSLYVKWFESSATNNHDNIPVLLYLLVALLLIILTLAIVLLRKKMGNARRIIFKQNEQLQLAIKAGDIYVWGYDVKKDIVYNIVGESIPNGGISGIEASKTIHPEDIPILEETLKKIIEGETDPEGVIVRSSYNVEGWHYIQKEFVGIKDDSGNVVTIIGTHKDINSQILEQNKIEDLLKKYQTVFDGSSVGLEIYDKDGVIIDYNYAEAEMLGITNISKNNIIDKKLNFYNNPSYNIAIPSIKENKSFEGIVEFDFDKEAIHVHLDGNKSGKRFIQLRITPILNSHGELENIVCASVDVTETIYLNKQLTHINQEKDFIIDMLPLGLMICNPDGIVIFMNEANGKIFGVKDIGEYIRRKINIFETNLVKPEIVDLIKSNCQEEFLITLNFEESVQKNLYNTKEVPIRYLKVNHRRITNKETGVDYIMFMIRDATDNHKYHTEIENGKRKLELALESSGLFQWEYHNSTQTICIVDAKGERYTTENEEVLAHVHKDDFEKAQEVLMMMERGDNKTFNVDLRMKSKFNDDILFISLNGAPLEFSKEGKVIAYTGFRKDNTKWYNLNEELKKQNEMNLMILENINSGLVCLDKDHTVLWENVSDKFPLASPCQTQMFITGTKCEDTHGAYKPKCAECLIDSVLSRCKSNSTQKILPDGRVLEIVASNIKNSDGIFTGAVLRVDDISDRKKLDNDIRDAKKLAEYAHELLSEILDRTPCAIFIKDADDDFKYILANKYFCEKAHRSKKEILNRNDYELYDKEYADNYRAVDLKVIEEDMPTTIVEEKEKDGVLKYWSTTKSLIKTDDGRRLLIALGLDLTDVYNANRELKIAKEKAEQSDKLKSSFLANMSHEIRTPLNAIVGFSELLCDADDDEKIAYNKIIATNNDLLLRLINDILDLSKIDAGAVVLNQELIDFSSFFDEMALTMQQRMKNPDVEFIVDNPYEECLVKVDKSRISQVLLNYVTNAIKYTPTGQIKMGYEYVNKGIKFWVQDTGIGIVPEKREKVFGRFQKLDEFAQGTGLGLSICKAIMELHGGTVGFESEPGKGSTFWAWKPDADKKVLKEKSSANTIFIERKKDPQLVIKQSHGKCRILVVEDDDSNYLLVQSILKDKCDLQRAINGLEAVGIVKDDTMGFDIILMDINMPVMNGLDATAEIRKFNTKIPIIAVTAYAYEADKQRAMNAGCTGFVSKPVKNGTITAEIEKNFGGTL